MELEHSGGVDYTGHIFFVLPYRFVTRICFDFVGSAFETRARAGGRGAYAGVSLHILGK